MSDPFNLWAVITFTLAIFCLHAGAVMHDEIRDAWSWVFRQLNLTHRRRVPAFTPQDLDELCRIPLAGKVITRDTAGFPSWDVIEAELAAHQDEEGKAA